MLAGAQTGSSVHDFLQVKKTKVGSQGIHFCIFKSVFSTPRRETKTVEMRKIFDFIHVFTEKYDANALHIHYRCSYLYFFLVEHCAVFINSIQICQNTFNAVSLLWFTYLNDWVSFVCDKSFEQISKHT